MTRVRKYFVIEQQKTKKKKRGKKSISGNGLAFAIAIASLILRLQRIPRRWTRRSPSSSLLVLVVPTSSSSKALGMVGKSRNAATRRKVKAKDDVKVVKVVKVVKEEDSADNLITVSSKLESASESRCLTKDEIVEIRSTLLDWYDHNHRVLPWRRNPFSKLKRFEKDSETDAPSQPEEIEIENCDPRAQKNNTSTSSSEGGGAGTESQFAYCVWVSEMMLQQTQVKTVKAYYQRWLERYPTVQDLACSDLETVNKLWAGLGYYRRAKFLLEGAKYVCTHHDGHLPSNVQDLLKIPGIGLYTASAIASIAFRRQAGVVDGNVIRVLSRLRALEGDPRRSDNTKLHWKLSNELVDADRPGCFNQSLMELGATICTPKAPQCNSCPLRGNCKALGKAKESSRRMKGSTKPGIHVVSVTDYPEKVKKKPPREETIRSCIFVLRRDDNDKDKHFLLVKRPDKGLLAGLWEFPNVPVAEKAASLGKASKLAGRNDLLELLVPLLDKCTVDREIDLKLLGEFTHVFSHIKQKNIVDYYEAKVCEDFLHRQILRSARALPKVKFVSCSSQEVKELSTGVRKAINLYTKFSKEKKMHISNYFSAAK